MELELSSAERDHRQLLRSLQEEENSENEFLKAELQRQVRVHAFLCACVYMHAYVRVHPFLRVHAYVHACVRECVYVCVHVFVCVRVCVCLCSLVVHDIPVVPLADVAILLWLSVQLSFLSVLFDDFQFY